MALKRITYFVDGKKKNIEVKICDTPSSKFAGLMFKRRSPPLLFVFDREKKLSIHSFFCRPFRAIWLDKNMNSTKIVDVKTWKPSISGKGKFLLEVPVLLSNDKSSSGKGNVYNRNI